MGKNIIITALKERHLKKASVVHTKLHCSTFKEKQNLPIDIASKCIDLSIVTKDTHRLSSIPARKCVCRESRMYLQIQSQNILKTTLMKLHTLSGVKFVISTLKVNIENDLVILI